MKHSFKEWMLVVRPWSFPAAIIPATLAVSYVFYSYHAGAIATVNWWYGILAIVGAVIWQAAGNLISDYFDFKKGVDRKETFGSSRMLVEGIFTPKEILLSGLFLMMTASFIGIFFLKTTYPSLHLWWIGTIAVLGTFFYYVLKYRALGDLNIYVIFGLLISLGTYLVMTNSVDWRILLLSSATGFLIVNILHANNMRDIKHDGEAKIKTQAMLFGTKVSIIQYAVLGYGAYLIVVFCVLLGIIHWLTLIVFLTFPLLMKNIKKIKMVDVEKPELIKDMDAQTAQHLTVFGALLIIANFVAVWII